MVAMTTFSAKKN